MATSRALIRSVREDGVNASLLKEATRWNSVLLSWLKDFGLTPASRYRLPTVRDGSEKDPLDKLIDG
jgi:hypothetical protein